MRLPGIQSVCLPGLLASLMAAAAAAHPISVSRASVYLTPKQADVRIEIFLEDLYLFHQLKLNREDVLEAAAIERGITLHNEFLNRRFQITDVEGSRIERRTQATVSADIPPDGVPLAQLMEHTIVFEFVLSFPARPDVLTFTQRFTDEAAVLPSEVQLSVQQKNAGAAYEHTLLPHEPWSLVIDWNHPPLSPEASQHERADWEARRNESLLGIASYSRAYSFLYVEDFEVRHEILVPVLTLAEDLSLVHEHGVLSVTDQNNLRPAIENYFTTGNLVVINGDEQTPIVQRCEFFGLDMKDFAQASDPKPVPIANARVGIILVYRPATRPTSLQMTWDRFNDDLRSVTAVTIARDEVLRSNLNRLGERNVLHWERSETAAMQTPPLQPVPAATSERPRASFPWLSCLSGLVGIAAALHAVLTRTVASLLAAVALLLCTTGIWLASDRNGFSPTVKPLSDRESLDVFRQLHGNLFRSFTGKREEAIYDALALSIDGNLLPDVYLDMRRGLALEDQGGPSTRIQDIEVVDARRIDTASDSSTSFRVQCRWNVSGVIEHWGHVHRRTNQYAAQFVVSPVEGFWKLVDMQLLDQQHLESQTSLRTL